VQFFIEVFMAIKIFTVAEMVAAERAADAAGVSYDEMMETAGRRVAEAIIVRKDVSGCSVLVLVGPGNNGGDGLVAGRFLAEAGADVAFYLYKPRDPAADINFQLVQQMGLFIVEAQNDQGYRVLRTRLHITDILVDALLGTGVTRAITGDLAGLMKEVKSVAARRRNKAAEPDPLVSISELPGDFGGPDGGPEPLVAAVDCPSGLNCDSGALDTLAVAADLTVTFAGPKRGHFRFPGAGACGELVVADINIKDTLPEVAGVPLTLVTPEMACSLLPERPAYGHKGTFGTVLVAAGSEHYWGAPLLSGRGAYRAGAGLVALAVPEIIRATVAGQLPEATYPPVSASLTLDAQSAEFLLSGAAQYQSLVAGPGIGSADSFITYLLTADPVLPPMLIDADGLDILSRKAGWAADLPPNTILTPHPGEMARLLAVALAELKEMDRVALAGQAAQEWGHIVLLKGAYSIVAAPDGRLALLPFANPLLAVGGSGDVLAGVIAAYLAQGLDPYEAAVLGGYIHGAAAELASQSFGDAGLLAGEIADWVPEARKHLLRH
jgi:ADP-dependent NAD(P)H-hydrate dehydratase / NAD(P)H-hydrate epimerase